MGRAGAGLSQSARMSTDRQDAENPPLQGRSAEQADNAATPVRPEGHARPGRASRLKALLEQGRRHRFGPEALPANLSAPFIRRPVATALLTFAIALAGIVAFGLLPVAPLPQVDFPVVIVRAKLPGAGPETMHNHKVALAHLRQRNGHFCAVYQQPDVFHIQGKAFGQRSHAYSS